MSNRSSSSPCSPPFGASSRTRNNNLLCWSGWGRHAADAAKKVISKSGHRRVLPKTRAAIGQTNTSRLWGKKGHLMRWRRECPPNAQQVCLFTKHLEIARGACPQIDMQLVRDFVPRAPLSIEEIITLGAPAPPRQPRAASTSTGAAGG